VGDVRQTGLIDLRRPIEILIRPLLVGRVVNPQVDIILPSPVILVLEVQLRIVVMRIHFDPFMVLRTLFGE
jgi:hypothetical protein